MVAITLFNFKRCQQHDIDQTLEENAKHLGGQRNARRVVARLARSPNMLKAIFQAGEEFGLRPRFVAASLFTELDPGYKDGPINTFGGDGWGMGMDVFADEYPLLVSEGLLPKEFRQSFKRDSETLHNEANTKFHKAIFRRIENAIRAHAAMLKHRRELMRNDLTKAGIVELSEDEEDYWTLVYYNSRAPKKHLIDERVKPSGAAGVTVPTEKFQEPGDSWNSLGNAQRMLAIKWLLKWAGMVDPADTPGLIKD
jgi:hypothetical protein